MRVTVLEDYAGLSAAAAGLVAGVIWARPDAVLGLPTGATPEGMYRVLRQMAPRCAAVRTFNLDEYVGIPAGHPQSYAAYMRRHLLDWTDIPAAQAQVPDGMSTDLAAECDRYEAAIRGAGGLDLVVLGLGPNGHIGFNEPGAPWEGRTRPVDLSAATRRANAPYFPAGQEVPRRALTMGIGTILAARRILVLASGAGKAAIVARFLGEGPTLQLPATALHRHPDVTVLLDRAAARRAR